jgi:uncharacterized protein YcfJ
MKTYFSLMIVSLIFLSGCSSTPRNPAIPTGLVVGEVVQVVKAPDRCKENDKSASRGLVGAIVGTVIGHQIGGGSGKNWAKGIGAIGGYAIGKNTNTENDDLTICKERGYLVKVVYYDNYGQPRYHEKRFSKPRRTGQLIEFKL